MTGEEKAAFEMFVLLHLQVKLASLHVDVTSKLC